MGAETGSCTEIRSFWYTVREGRKAAAKRNVVLQLPDGETQVFIDPQEYPPSIALAELISRSA